MTAVEDVNGNVTRYAYDALGRLTVVRDPQERILKRIAYQYRTYQGDTSRPYYHDNTYTPSVAADMIRVDPSQTVRGCPVTLSVEGGALGTEAQWHWYSAGCGVTPAGTGSSITVFPAREESYFVRAEGKVNNTACRSVVLQPAEPAFCPDRDTLFISSSGTSHPVIIVAGYTGCEPWGVTATGDWITITEKEEDAFSVTVTANTADTTRTAYLRLQAGGTNRMIPVLQEAGNGTVALTLTASPKIAVAGTTVTITAEVSGCSFPDFSWKMMADNGDQWTELTPAPGEENSVHITAGNSGFTVSCSVTCGEGTVVTDTIHVTVAE
jgi:YD repeat-containing protein